MQLIGERAKRARHYQGCTNLSWCGIYIYLITSILRNIASQLQCISASAAGTSAIPVTDKQYFSVAM